ncbi:hypothetical protein KBD20_00940 [Candidatus Saccharibacteria bacterium]|nr:hypothetical protein [Candidatus Saccharibacteria bacterium]
MTEAVPVTSTENQEAEVVPLELVHELGKAGTELAVADGDVSSAISHQEMLDSSELDAGEQAYVDQALANLRATSRTAGGVVDTSASATKQESMVGGMSSEQVADTAVENFTEAIGVLFEHRGEMFESPEDLRGFVEAVAAQINGGIVKEGMLIRSGADSLKYAYTKVAELDSAMEEFYSTFLDRLNDPNTDPVELAGWVEYRIDLTDHFFADGCGKSAKALSAWVLMRAGHDLPTYRGRDELYANAPSTIRTEGSEVVDKEMNAWLDYYKTLF